jgi:hypothetical protein
MRGGPSGVRTRVFAVRGSPEDRRFYGIHRRKADAGIDWYADDYSAIRGAASDEYEQTLLDRIHKKANDFLSKPTIPRPGRK